MNKPIRVWSLHEAKARFSEVVRLAQSQGPQTVTVHGKAAVQVVPISSVAGQSIGPSVEEIAAAFRACPVPDFDIPRIRSAGRFREPPV